MKRVLTAAVAAPLALAAVFFLPRPAFLVFLLVLISVAAFEFIRLSKSLGASKAIVCLPGMVVLAVVMLVPGLVELSVELRLLALAGLGAIVSGVAAIVLGGSVRQRVTSLGLLAFGAAYLALPVAAFDALRTRDVWLVVLLLAIVWGTDAGAYYSGRAWGHRKLAPELSPNKTRVGAVGGVAVAVLAAAIWSLLRLGSIEPTVLAIAVPISLAGQVGDLLESLLKRAAGVKDSGTIFPGHGGVLDRLDSLFVAGPVLTALVPLLER